MHIICDNIIVEKEGRENPAKVKENEKRIKLEKLKKRIN